MSLQLNIDYPETLPDAMGRTREQFEREAKWAFEVGDFLSESNRKKLVSSRAIARSEPLSRSRGRKKEDKWPKKLINRRKSLKFSDY